VNDFRTCAEVHEVVEELALGTISGPQRAQAIAHLDSCARCRDMVDALTTVTDSLLLLGPDEPPPLGFEARVATAMSPAATDRPPTRGWRRLAMIGAVAAALSLGGLVGHLLTSTSTGGSEGARVALAAADGGRATCRAVVIPGSPAHLLVTVDEPGDADGDSGDYVVETAPSGPGPTQTVGTLRLVDGHGVLSTSIAGPADDIRSVRVFQAGQLRYEARF
jgi:hypothetical protein